MSIFVEDLFTSAKISSFMPTSQNTFQNEQNLVIANEALQLELVGDIFKRREEFFLTHKDVDLVAGVPRLTIPKRAIGLTFKSLWYVENGEPKHEIVQGNEEDYLDFAGQTGTPVKFLLEGDEVLLLPKPSESTGSVRFRYYAKPNLLTLTANCARINSVSSVGGTTTFGVNTDLTAVTNPLVVGSKIDILSVVSPFLLWTEGAEITAISSSQIECATSLVTNEAGVVEPQIGDYICPSGYANVPMIPYEFHPVLAKMIAKRQVSGMGDMAKRNMIAADLKDLRTEAENMIKNRVESQPKVMRPGRNGILNAFRR